MKYLLIDNQLAHVGVGSGVELDSGEVILTKESGGVEIYEDCRAAQATLGEGIKIIYPALSVITPSPARTDLIVRLEVAREVITKTLHELDLSLPNADSGVAVS